MGDSLTRCVQLGERETGLEPAVEPASEEATSLFGVAAPCSALTLLKTSLFPTERPGAGRISSKRYRWPTGERLTKALGSKRQLSLKDRDGP
jgi:hypothetical protein